MTRPDGARGVLLAGIAVLSLGVTGWAVSAATQSPSPSTGRLAIVNKARSALTVVNLRDGTRQVFRTGYLPHENTVAGNLVFVSNYGGEYIRSSSLANRPGNTISIADLSRPGQEPEVLDLGPGRCAPHGLAASRDGRHVYVTCEGRQEIVVIDVATRRLSHAIPTSQAGSHMLVVSSDDSRAYVANFWHGTVTVLDLKDRSILAQIETGAGTEGIGLSPDDRYLYTTSPVGHEITRTDTGSLAVVARRAAEDCRAPIRVVPTPDDGAKLVVNCADDGKVLILDAGTLGRLHEIRVGALPIGLAVSDGRRAFSASMNDGTITIIDIERGTVVDTIDAGEQPDGIAWLPY